MFSSHIRLARRAQNLSERYRKLENATRPTPEHGKPILARRTTSDTFAGFVIPKEPRALADDECCMSGCAVCVYDVYEEELSAYKESVRTLRAALSTQGIPEIEWPAHIKGNEGDGTKGTVMDAFEAMERALKEKHTAESSS